MPQGFKLYIHKQPRSNGEIREDYYCFVCPTLKAIFGSLGLDE